MTDLMQKAAEAGWEAWCDSPRADPEKADIKQIIEAALRVLSAEAVDKNELADWVYEKMARLAPAEYGGSEMLRHDLRAIFSGQAPLFLAPQSIEDKR